MTTARFIENALAFKAAVQLDVTPESLVLEFNRDLPGAWIGASVRRLLTSSYTASTSMSCSSV